MSYLISVKLFMHIPLFVLQFDRCLVHISLSEGGPERTPHGKIFRSVKRPSVMLTITVGTCGPSGV